MGYTDKWQTLHFWGWILAIVSTLLSVYSFCAFRFFFIWNVSPPRVCILCLSIIAFILGLMGIRSRSNKALTAFTILSSLGLTFILLFSMAFFRVTRMQTTHSPDKHYNISFYSTDAGAGVSPTFIGYIDGPLWFKKRFYTAGIKNAPNNVTWENNSTLIVHHHAINLKHGQTYNAYD